MVVERGAPRHGTLQNRSKGVVVGIAKGGVVTWSTAKPQQGAVVGGTARPKRVTVRKAADTHRTSTARAQTCDRPKGGRESRIERQQRGSNVRQSERRPRVSDVP